METLLDGTTTADEPAIIVVTVPLVTVVSTV
jgi:hypothetical protein